MIPTVNWTLSISKGNKEDPDPFGPGNLGKRFFFFLPQTKQEIATISYFLLIFLFLNAKFADNEKGEKKLLVIQIL